MPDFFPPVVATFVASTGEAVAQMTSLAGSFEKLGVQATTSMGEVAATVTGAGEKVTAAAVEITGANDKLVSSNARLAASIGSASAEWATGYQAMAATTAELSAQMELQMAKAGAAAEAMGAKIDAAAASTTATTAGKISKLTKIGAAVGVVGVLAGAEMVHMAADFETATNRLLTSAGESHDAIGMVRDGVLQMAGQVGVSADDLAKALYKVESAGYHGAAGLGLLKAAEQGAKAEGADATTVADALSSAMRDYYPNVKSAAEVTAASTDVMSKLVGATSAGKMTFDELAGALNSILPVSSAAKISLSDTLGVLASMTVHGISAQQATQNMADAIRHLQSPTMVMSKAMATLGIDSVDLASKLGERGLSGTMQLLSDRVKKAMPPGSDKVILDLGNALSKSAPKVQELGQKLLTGEITMKQYSGAAGKLEPIAAKQAMAFGTLAGSYHQLGTQQLSGADVMVTYAGMMQKLMGDATGLKVALMTTGDNAQYTNDAIATVSGSTADAAGNVKGWADIQGTFNQKLAEAKEGFGALVISIGQKLMPIASKIMDVFAKMAHWFGEHKWAATALAYVLGGALVIGLAAATGAAWNFAIALLANPMTWIVLGIGVLIAAIVLLATHWNQIWQWIKTTAGEAWNWLKSNVFQPIGDFFNWIWHNVLEPFVGFWKSAWDGLKLTAQIAWEWIDRYIFHPIQVGLGAIGSAIAWLGEVWGRIWHWMGDTIEWVYDHTIKPIIDGIKEAIRLSQQLMGFNPTVGGNSIPGTPVPIPGFDEGGWVPGAVGQPMLAIVHGGERVLSVDEMAGRSRYAAPAMTGAAPTRPATGGAGGTMVNNFHIAGSVIAERDLHRLIQQLTLRYNQRNTGNGLNLGFA